MTVNSIKPHFEIRYNVIGPKAGVVVQGPPIAITLDMEHALHIANALNSYRKYPEREYYVSERKEVRL